MYGDKTVHGEGNLYGIFGGHRIIFCGHGPSGPVGINNVPIPLFPSQHPFCYLNFAYYKRVDSD